MTYRTIIVAAAVLAGLGGAASAAEALNMVGVWKADASVAFIGKTPHRTPTKDGPNFSEELLPVEFNITEQKGQHFAGILKIGKLQETVIGSVDMDNDDGLMLDDDGQWTFEVRAPDRIDLCYHHVAPDNKVVGCFPATKVK